MATNKATKAASASNTAPQSTPKPSERPTQNSTPTPTPTPSSSAAKAETPKPSQRPSQTPTQTPTSSSSAAKTESPTPSRRPEPTPTPTPSASSDVQDQETQTEIPDFDEIDGFEKQEKALEEQLSKIRQDKQAAMEAQAGIAFANAHEIITKFGATFSGKQKADLAKALGATVRAATVAGASTGKRKYTRRAVADDATPLIAPAKAAKKAAKKTGKATKKSAKATKATTKSATKKITKKAAKTAAADKPWCKTTGAKPQEFQWANPGGKGRRPETLVNFENSAAGKKLIAAGQPTYVVL